MVLSNHLNDLLLGANHEHTPDGVGKIYLYFGGTNPAGTFDINGTAGRAPDVVILGASNDDHLASDNSLVIADFNADGINDIATSTRWGDGPGEARPNAGEAYIIYGSTSWPSTVDLASAEQDVIIYGADNSDELTNDGAIAVGDVNGDGVSDLILGTRSADGPSEERPGCGEAYIIYGSTNLPPTIDLANADEDVTIYGPHDIYCMTAGRAQAPPSLTASP